jgi:hypothetical protein
MLGLRIAKINTLVLILVFTVSLAANSSLLGTYYFAGDDYFQFDKSIADWFATRGIWRIVGIPLAGWLVSRDVYAFAIIAAHAIGGYFFFLVARRGFGSVTYALFLTIIVMAFPWGSEALMWGSAAAYAFASCLLWVILWALLSVRADQPKIYVKAAGLLFASFLCLLIHEAVFFSLCVAGFVVWMRPDFWREWKSAAAVSLAPLVGALLWGVIYELTKPAVPIYSVTHLDLRAALSPLFYQYRSLEVFDVWANDLLRNYAISTIQSPNLILALLALCAVPFLVGAIMRAARVESVDTARQQKTQITPIAFLIWMVLVCEGRRIYLCTGRRLRARRAEELYHYADGNHECRGSNMGDLGTATDPHILGQWQLSRDKCDLHFRLLDELVGDVDRPNGSETRLPAR